MVHFERYSSLTLISFIFMCGRAKKVQLSIFKWRCVDIIYSSFVPKSFINGILTVYLSTGSYLSAVISLK